MRSSILTRDGVDLAVIGAGVVGCAVAQAAAQAGLSVAVLDRELGEGRGITSRNSGVIHSGLYYPPDSLKAQSCVRGQALLYEWLGSRDVAHLKTGKLVVAHDDHDMEALEALHANAIQSGARKLTLLTADQVHDMEPDLPVCKAGLYCELSGIVDSHELTRTLLADAHQNGAWSAWLAQVTDVSKVSGGYYLNTSRGPLHAERVVNAAGLFADDVARYFGYQAPKVHPCRGDYFRLKTKAHFRHLIYPARKQSQAGLGIHLTIDLAGDYRVGPDAEFVESKTDFTPREDKATAFRVAAERLLGPSVGLHWDGCGIRPKLRRPDETEDRDFLLVESPAGAFHFLGIESPGLTAALSLAERLLTRF